MESYKQEHVGNKELAEAYTARAHAEHAKTALAKSSYITSLAMQTRALMVRRVQIIRGGILAQGIQMSYVCLDSQRRHVLTCRSVFILQAIIIGTIFLNSPNSTSSFFSRGGVIFL